VGLAVKHLPAQSKVFAQGGSFGRGKIIMHVNVQINCRLTTEKRTRPTVMLMKILPLQ